ncbi:MAG: histidine--tRNA ligase [Clostridia bacterium]|nr:histidine--tRNA ligase [Clostridia bacterium]
MAYKAPKGTRDVLPSESYKWQYIENIIREITAKYGIREARTPVIEHTELFLRGVGQTTDIVQKEMYTFNDKGDRSITLKPEGTAGMVRLFVEHNLYADVQPTKMYYLTNPVFRYEKPQAGRLREHHQFGVEMFGAARASADAECISIVIELLDRLGLKGLAVRLNSIGCPDCRPKYQAALKEFLRENYDSLCETCRTRYETNPLRILDCKVPSCGELLKGAPVIGDFLCDDCKKHMDELTTRLELLGIKYEITPTLVRGLDYYTKTVFEVFSDQIGSQGAICGGGRYDNLVEELGGPALPAVGFGLGMERLLLLMEETKTEIPAPERCDVYLAGLGEKGDIAAFALAQNLRALGLKCETDLVGRSLKAQMKFADKIGAGYVCILGEDEIAKNEILLKDMRDGTAIPTAIDAEQINNIINQRR